MVSVEETRLSEEEIEELLKTSDGVLDELTNEVKHVSVRIDSSSTDIITAVVNIFGKEYINSDGSTFITHEMYDNVLDILRSAGSLKVGEYL